MGLVLLVWLATVIAELHFKRCNGICINTYYLYIRGTLTCGISTTFHCARKEARDTPPGFNITRIDILAHTRSVFIRAYRQCGGGSGNVLRARRAALCSNGESDNRVCVTHKTAHAVNASVCVCWEPLAAVGAGGRNVQRVKHVHHVSNVNRYISDTRFCVGEACSRAHTR